MRPFPLLAWLAGSIAVPATAQQPVDEIAPGAAASGGSVIAMLDPCSTACAPVDITTPTGDIRILGVAHARNVGKWFFSGSNNGATGPQKIYVFDQDAVGKPDPATVRSFDFRGTSAFWGARDLAYSDDTGMIYHGDEARTLLEIDPFAEAYTGRQVALASTAATIRALAITESPVAGQMRVAVADFSTPVEVFDVDVVAFTAAPTGISYANPGGTYGASYAVGGEVLLLFRQAAHSCAPQGLHTVTAIDALSGIVLLERAGDPNIPGTAPNVQGGIAGGAELTTVGGQDVVAVLHQAVNDTLGFVPVSGFGEIGPPDCDDSRLLPVGNATLGNPEFGLRITGAPSNGFAALILAPAPPIGLPIGNGCVLDANPGLGIQVIFGLDALGQIEIRLPIPNDPAIDGVRLVTDVVHTVAPFTALGSTNAVTVTITIGIWRLINRPRCERCRRVVDQVNECLHFVGNVNCDPCSQSECIQNDLDTASCRRRWWQIRDPNCNTGPVAGPEVVQTARAMSCNQNKLIWTLWKTLWWGCGTDCNKQTYNVACVVPRCAGNVTRGPFNRGVKKACK